MYMVVKPRFRIIALNVDFHIHGLYSADKNGRKRVYSGSWPGPRILISQGQIHRNRTINYLISDGKVDINGYIYLRYIGIMEGITREYPDIFLTRDKIYTAGGSMVYR